MVDALDLDDDVSGSQMELLLESDEEEASLLEEMEKQEAVQVSGSLEYIKSQKGEASMIGTLKLIDNNELFDMNNSFIDSALVERSIDENDCDSVEGSQSIPDQQNIIEKLYQEHLKGKSSRKWEGKPVQILQLNISENDIIAAKSAAAFQSHTKNSKASLTSQVISFTDIQGGFPFEDPAYDIPSSDEKGTKRKISKTKREKNKKKSVELKNDFEGSKSSSKMKTLPMKGLMPEVKSSEDDFSGQPLPYKRRKHNIVVSDSSDTTTSSVAMPLKEGLSVSTVVNFFCNFCKFKCPLTEENIPKIVEHLNPSERYNQPLQIPERVNFFKENVKLSVMIAKNKSKAQVRLVSRLECLSCNQQFTNTIGNSEHIVIHNHWCCQRSSSDNKTVLCIFCEEFIPRGFIKKHLQQRSKKQCKKVHALTLQLMSSVCKEYAENNKPLCVVCNEKEWPYKGHRSELEPVCEPCRFNIVSGNTTRLLRRDLTGCAICGRHCAEKYVTYWASEMESLFIGESCINKLKDPKPKAAEEIVICKTVKLKNLVETALASVRVQENLKNSEVRESTDVIPDTKPAETCDNRLSYTVKLDTMQMKKVTNNNLNNSSKSAENLTMGKTVKNGFKQVASSYKIVGSAESLPFSTLMPEAAATNFKVCNEIVGKGNNWQLQGAVPQTHSFSEGGDSSADNVVQKSHKNVRNKSVLLTVCSESNNTGDMPQKTDLSNEKYIFKINGSKEQRNISESVSSSQFNQNSSSPSRTNSHVSVNAVKLSQQPKFVIKYVSSSKSKPLGEIDNFDKNHIVIKTTSNEPCTSSPVEPPRLAKVIKTAKSVCEEGVWESERLLLENIREINQTAKKEDTTELVTLE